MTGRTVCLAMHYQNEVLHGQGKIKVGVAEHDSRRQGVVDAAGKLLGGMRAHAVPVVSVRIAFRPDHRDVIQNCPIFRAVAASGAMAEGSWGAEFHEGLGPLPDEFVVKHSRVNGFYGSTLEQVLHQLGARRLVVAGIATNSTVEHTVRHASDMGFEVIVAQDACSAGDPRLHQASLDNMALVAEISTVAQALAGVAS